MDKGDCLEEEFMNIAILYDFGVHLGGGDFVMLNVLEALINAGYGVHLITTYPRGLSIATRFFGKPVTKITVHYIKSTHMFKHPYTIAFLARIIKTFSSKDYDLYMVSDDIPLVLADKKGIAYIHYPHAARIRLKKYISAIYRSSIYGKLLWRIHEMLFPLFFATKSRPQKWLLLANSLVTRKHVAETFNIDVDKVLLLHPPVQSKAIYGALMKESVEKENLIVCVGRFELDKRFMDVLYAFFYVGKRIRNAKLSLIGFRHSENLLHRIIAKLGLEQNVELLINADRKTLINRLISAKALVHPAPHELFGIAVVEGMAAGAIPIVRKGVNGPWLEITQRGKYGIGFSDVKELIDAIITALTSYESFSIKSIIDRALQFNEEVFKERLLSILRSYINEEPN
jgi:glycosyltransferase involved in cell wall biosynthesis